VLNEEIGFFRRVSESENALNAVKEAFEIIEELGLGSDTSSATVYLNGATTMKAFGKATEAMPYYMMAKDVFERELDPNDYKMAALYNNMSSAYNDLGDYKSCEEFCFKAISILENNEDCYGEIAVTLINLAHLYYEQDPLDDRIYDMMDKAWELLTSSSNTLDGNFAYLCAKCYPSFGFFGYFEREAQLIRLTEHIYEGN
jgi:tetratricopeptide (TPR) repeat protein